MGSWAGLVSSLQKEGLVSCSRNTTYCATSTNISANRRTFGSSISSTHLLSVLGAMGIMSKIKPKSNKVFSKTGPAPTSGDLFASTGGEDEPTLFTCLMILYYGMYALTLLFYPSVHAADGPMGTTNN